MTTQQIEMLITLLQSIDAKLNTLLTYAANTRSNAEHRNVVYVPDNISPNSYSIPERY